MITGHGCKSKTILFGAEEQRWNSKIEVVGAYQQDFKVGLPLVGAYQLQTEKEMEAVGAYYLQTQIKIDLLGGTGWQKMPFRPVNGVLLFSLPRHDHLAAADGAALRSKLVEVHRLGELAQVSWAVAKSKLNKQRENRSNALL